jgi:hypothetical protein
MGFYRRESIAPGPQRKYGFLRKLPRLETPEWGDWDEKVIRKPTHDTRLPKPWPFATDGRQRLFEELNALDEAEARVLEMDAGALPDWPIGGDPPTDAVRNALLRAIGAAEREREPDFDALLGWVKAVEAEDSAPDAALLAILRAAIETEHLRLRNVFSIVPDQNQDDGDETELTPLSAAEAQRVAGAAASAINHTLARLFLRLGPPPEDASGDFMPVSSGGGGAQQ